MKLDDAKVTAPIDLAEYDEAYRGKIVRVWISPPRGKLLELALLLKATVQLQGKVLGALPRRQASESGAAAAADNASQVAACAAEINATLTRLYAWFAETWSQGPDPESHWTVDEIQQLDEQDPRLFTWIVRRHRALLDEALLPPAKDLPA